MEKKKIKKLPMKVNYLMTIERWDAHAKEQHKTKS
jgi:hypothetical protein